MQTCQEDTAAPAMWANTLHTGVPRRGRDARCGIFSARMPRHPFLASGTDARTRPTVLLADDHPGFAASVSATLEADFDVIGVAADGAQAIDIARRADPDLIVLDITMPGMDGFQVVRSLEQAGTRGRVVFLSMHDEDEYVREAFRCGGRGYVLKTRAGRDLVNALDHVHLGRVFVPSLSSLFLVSDGADGHAMQLVGDERAFLDGIATLFDLALQQGDATCVIGMDWFREGLSQRLRARGWVVDGPTKHPRYLAINTAEALDQLIRSGTIEEDHVAGFVGEMERYRLSAAEGPARRLTICGDTSGRLLATGQPNAAVDLERNWSRLTKGLPFLTLCSYSAAASRHDGTHPEAFQHVCAEHSAVIPALGA